MVDQAPMKSYAKGAKTDKKPGTESSDNGPKKKKPAKKTKKC